LHLVSLADPNHFLRYAGTGFSGVVTDGPQLAGHQGGELATNMGGDNWSLRWDASGNTFSRASSRAPIFYDSNDTAYYADPNGTSVLNGLHVGTGSPVFTSSSFQYHYHLSPHIAYVKKSGGFSWYWRRNDTGLANGTNEVEDMSLTEGGDLIARSTVRAPLFYDSNDTGYYIDPNTTGLGIRTAGELWCGIGIDGDGVRINHDQIWTPAGNFHIQYSAYTKVEIIYI
jgi:hypothetical protein